MERRRSGIVNGDDFCCSSSTNPQGAYPHGCTLTGAYPLGLWTSIGGNDPRRKKGDGGRIIPLRKAGSIAQDSRYRPTRSQRCSNQIY